MRRKSQAALEFIITYGWAFLVVLVSISALAYFGVLGLDRFVPDKCTFPSGIACLDEKATASAIAISVQNSVGYDINIDALKAQQCTAIGSQGKLSNGNIRQITMLCNNTGTKYSGTVNITYTKLDTFLQHTSQGQVIAKIQGEESGDILGLPSIKVLSIYPCGCLINQIVANYGNVPGYPTIEVTCVQRDSFTPDFDLSPYKVIAFDGADCWPGSIGAGSEQNVENFVRNGGAAIFSHDFFLGNKHTILSPVAGFSRIDTCCQGVANSKLFDDAITKTPYALPDPIPIQCTHGSGEVQKPEAREEYGGSDVYDHYFITNLYGSGKSVFTEWGHCAYDCACGLNGGMPASDESKSLINAIYWASG